MVYTIQPEEVGVLQRFGKFIKINGPGLHFKIPFGVDKITKKGGPQYTLKQEFGYRSSQAGKRTKYERQSSLQKEVSLMLTGDLNIASVEWSIQYQIKDPIKYLFNIDDPEATLADASESAMRLIVGDRSVDEVLDLWKGRNKP